MRCKVKAPVSRTGGNGYTKSLVVFVPSGKALSIQGCVSDICAQTRAYGGDASNNVNMSDAAQLSGCCSKKDHIYDGVGIILKAHYHINRNQHMLVFWSPSCSNVHNCGLSRNMWKHPLC